MGKLFLDQSDHFGIALVKLQSYVQPHLFVRQTRLSVSNPYGHLLASPSQHRSASSYLLRGGHRFPATFVFKFDFRLFHPDLLIPVVYRSVYWNAPKGQSTDVLRNRFLPSSVCQVALAFLHVHARACLQVLPK
ncbi:MAG: hypothetical protein DWH99_02515 [Planctomycetota bacterium]|nr:MAG: hypothetical protein DWH99_02515 [Planctomycetota bacterium]